MPSVLDSVILVTFIGLARLDWAGHRPWARVVPLLCWTRSEDILKHVEWSEGAVGLCGRVSGQW